MTNCILIAHVLVNMYGTQIVTDTKRILITSPIEQMVKVYECPLKEDLTGIQAAREYFKERNKSR